MKTAIFTNWTDQVFIGWWGGKKRKYEPGQSEPMPDYVAKHFAKHLANQELLRRNPDGSLKYKNGDKYVSPKKPADVPVYLELFNKGYSADESEEQLGEKSDDLDSLINIAKKKRSAEFSKPTAEANQNPAEPQVVLPPDFNEEEEDFEGKPDEVQS